MLKKYILSLLILFLAICHINAQSVPGYLGKKTFVDYNLTIPHLIYLIPNPSNLMHNFRIHRVFRRRAAVALSVDLFSMEGKGSEGIGFNEADYSEINGTAIGVSFEWYNKTSIAPLGRYFRIDAKFFRTSYVDTFSGFNGNQEVEGDYTSPYLGFGFGMRRVFFDKMVFNVGGTIGLTLNSFDDESGHGYVLGVNNYFQSHIGVGVLLK